MQERLKYYDCYLVTDLKYRSLRLKKHPEKDMRN